jgi:hypothetical protein
VANKRFIVKLSSDERKRLGTLISKGKAAAKTILKTRILLKADQSEAGEGWSGEKICEALDTSGALPPFNSFGAATSVRSDASIQIKNNARLVMMPSLGARYRTAAPADARPLSQSSWT